MKSKKQLIFLLFIIITGAILRLYSLGHESLWADEAFSEVFSSKPIAEMFNEIKYDAHPPLYYILIHFLLHIGNNEYILRLPSAICSIISLFFIYKLADRNNKKEAIVAAFLFSFSYSSIFMAKMARMYPLQCLFAILCAYFIKKIITDKEEKIIYWILYIFSATALIYTQYTGFIFLGALNIYFIIFRFQTWKHLKKWIISHIIILVFFTPWIGMFIQQSANGGGQLLPSPTIKIICDVFINFIYGGLFSITVELYPLILIPVIFIIYFAIKSEKTATSNYSLSLYIFFITLSLTLAISIGTEKKIFSEKHFFYGLPFLYIILARGYEEIRKKWKIFAAVIAILWIVLNGYSCYNKICFEKFQNTDWRNGIKNVENLSQPGDIILIQDTFQAFAFFYYYKGTLPAYTITPANIPGDINNLKKNNKRIWLLQCQEWHSDPDGSVKKWLDKNCRLKDTFNYFRIDRAGILKVNLYECK